MKNKEKRERLDGKYVLGILKEYRARMREILYLWRKRGKLPEHQWFYDEWKVRNISEIDEFENRDKRVSEKDGSEECNMIFFKQTYHSKFFFFFLR